MITVETVIALAIRERVVLDHLGEALRNDLCVANPFYRRIAAFADDFALQRNKLPQDGDWEMWLETVEEGLQRDGTREALGRLLALDVSGYDPEFFAEQALPQLRAVAAQVARTRLNGLTELNPEAFLTLATQVESIQSGAISGLAKLADVDTWARATREDELLPSGFPTLDQQIGGWGKELWIIFADSGVGKSMLLQNFATAAALRGKRVLHVTLELGMRPQILRYYRQIAQATRADFATDLGGVKKSLRHWLRFAKGEVLLLEYPAYSVTTQDLHRVLARVSRQVGPVDMLVLDYLDLVISAGGRSRSEYTDLGRITHEVRGFCPTFDLSVLTASQAVRRPEKAGRLTVRDMGDSYGKVRGVDGLISLMQTDEEEKVHQGRLGLLKIRDSGGRGTEIPLYINRELSYLQELGHPNTKLLMKRLNHFPVPPGSVPPGVGGGGVKQ